MKGKCSCRNSSTVEISKDIHKTGRSLIGGKLKIEIWKLKLTCKPYLDSMRMWINMNRKEMVEKKLWNDSQARRIKSKHDNLQIDKQEILYEIKYIEITRNIRSWLARICLDMSRICLECHTENSRWLIIKTNQSETN